VNRFCDRRGLLVDGKTALPDDPCEYWNPATLVPRGCTRLRCESCGKFVSSTVDGIERKYQCECRSFTAVSQATLENEHDSTSDPDVPWSCAGHDPPALPLELGGLTVGGDWDGLVARILGGSAPRALGLRTEGPGIWLGWLYAYLLELPEAESLSRAIGARAADGDPAVMGAVLWFFARFPSAPGIEKVIERAEAHPNDVAVGQLIPEYYVPTIWEVLLARLETHGKEPIDARVVALVQQALVAPLSSLSNADAGNPAWIDTFYSSLRTDAVGRALERTSGTFDDEELRLWLADHIVEIDAAAPGRWKKVMTRLSDWALKPETGHLILIAGMRLLERGVASPDALAEWIEWRRVNHGWMEDAWVLPLQDQIEQQRRQLTAN
jgi:hypothetical protein